MTPPGFSGILNDGKEFGAIQPTIVNYPSGRIQLLCRSRQGKITECWSNDGGQTWGPMRATALPNLSTGIDAVMLRDVRALRVYNHAPKGRTPLNVAVSRDGQMWEAALVLEHEPGEYSYPAVIQTSDGMVHISYTWKRQRVKHVVIDPAKLSLQPMVDGRWPKRFSGPRVVPTRSAWQITGVMGFSARLFKCGAAAVWDKPRSSTLARSFVPYAIPSIDVRD